MIVRWLTGFALAALLIACGGGGGGGNGGGAFIPPDPADDNDPPLSTDATLAALSLSSGALDQVFDPDLFEYTASVGFLTAGLSLNLATGDAQATVSVAGTAVAAGASSLVALAPGANQVVVSVTAEDGTTTNDYTLSISRAALSAVSQTVFIKPDVIDADDEFGSGVSIDGDWMAVSGFDDSLATGIDGDETDNNGASVGGVTIFEQVSPNVWQRQAYIKASNSDTDDLFGWVSLSGDTLAVGAAGEDSASAGIDGDQTDNSENASGAVYVFVRDANNVWSQQAYIKASSPDAGDEFGRFLSLDGDALAVASPLEDSAATGVNGDDADDSALDAGAVYVFQRTGTTWAQQAYIKASNTEAADFFGSGVALDDGVLVVGASGEDSSAQGVDGDQADNGALQSGAAYVFELDAQGLWQQTAYLKASNAETSDSFGFSVDLDSDQLVVGAVGEQSLATGVDGDQANNDGIFAGAAYLFAQNASGAWQQTNYFKASNTDNNDNFGQLVVLQDNTLVVSAAGEQSLGTGINGNELDNSGATVGAGYIYTRDGAGTWSQAIYLKSSNADTFDDFGALGLAFDGESLVVGAPGEDSGATGLNGDQLDNGTTDAGAGYLFQ